MAKLFYHRRTLVAAAHPNYIRITNLGHCRLRIINCEDDADRVQASVEIMFKNAPIGTAETIAIFRLQDSLGAWYDVGWEGDIELGDDQDLRILFTDTPITAPTAADVLHVTIGYEVIE